MSDYESSVLHQRWFDDAVDAADDEYDARCARSRVWLWKAMPPPHRDLLKLSTFAARFRKREAAKISRLRESEARA